MAMLVLPDVFERTWGRRPEPFWSRAIQKVRDEVPGFVFMAEVLGPRMDDQQEGFDYAYDKRLYDRLREKHARPARSTSSGRSCWPRPPSPGPSRRP